MSYIPQDKRERINNAILKEITFNSAAELSYAIMLLCLNYLKSKPGKVNAMLGAIEGAKSELTRDKVHPRNAQDRFDHGEIDT